MILKLIMALHSMLTPSYAVTLLKVKPMQHKIQAIIFDMDGTVLDTEILWEQGNRHILSTYAPHLTSEQVDEILHHRKGIRTPDELAEMLRQHCPEQMTTEDIRTIKTAYVFYLYETQGISFIPHFDEFHTKLHRQGLKSAIATNATGQALEKIVIKTPLRNYFNEHVYTIDKVNSRYKPNPDIYLHAAENLGVDPKNCIAIEDTKGGIKAAKAAGMYCIGINTGKNRENLKQADLIVECYSEINLDKLLQ